MSNDSPLIKQPLGGYLFLPGIAPYSSGVIADDGSEIIHVTLARPLPWHGGLWAARQYLQSRGLTHHALCGVELRCPKPHSMGGFAEFNSQYQALLTEWGMHVDGLNPLARTNVSPVVNPPTETVLHAFSFTVPQPTSQPTFVIAGGGELPHRDLDRVHIVRCGETSTDAMKDKAECVMRIMLHRLKKLQAAASMLSVIDVYTAHPLQSIVSDVIVAHLPEAAARGVQWFLSRPPIVEIEFEMDMRGVIQDLTVDLDAIVESVT